VLASAVFSEHRAVCAGALVKWGVKVSEVTSCKEIINLKKMEAFKCLTLHDLIYSDIFIVPTVCCTNSLLYQQSAVPTVCCTNSLLYLQSAVPTVCCTNSLLYLQSAVPTVCCTNRLVVT
jgi:hypothetical protein